MFFFEKMQRIKYVFHSLLEDKQQFKQNVLIVLRDDMPSYIILSIFFSHFQ